MQDYTDVDTRFGPALRTARQQAGLSQEAVALRMRELGFDMSQPVIGKIERNTRKVSLGEAEALSHVVKSSLHALMAGRDYLLADHASQVLVELRSRVQQSITALQSAQQLAAILADDLPESNERLERLILEPIDDVVRELENDNAAENHKNAYRDDLEREPDEALRLKEHDGFNPNTMFGKYMAKFGDTVNHTPTGEGLAMLFGTQAPTDDPERDE